MIWRLGYRAMRVATVAAMVLAGCGSSGVGVDAAGEPQTEPVAATPSSMVEPTPEEPTPVPTPAPAPTPAPSPTPMPSPTSTSVPVEVRTLLFSGDVLSHTPVIAKAQSLGFESGWAYDYRPMFADVSDRVTRADLAICVLETPVSADNTGLDGYPTFNAPRELPDALVDAGYDGCSTASNHSMDRGPTGVRTTLAQMDRVGLGHAGMARSALESARTRVYDVGGMSVAHLSYTYGLNGFLLPPDEPWLVNLNDVDAIVAEGERARAGGADLVVLSIQWGNEYQRQPSQEQQQLAEEITSSGAVDVIIGNHVHVVQPVETVNGVPVVYGLGNSLSNQYDTSWRTGTQDGVMIELTVEGNSARGYRIGELAFAPTWVDRTSYTIIDLIDALDDLELDPSVRSVYQTSFDRTVEAIALLGTELPLADGHRR